MGSLFPPAVLSSIPLPNSLLALPTMPSLGNCFPCGSVNLGKYVLYSSALSWQSLPAYLTCNVNVWTRYVPFFNRRQCRQCCRTYSPKNLHAAFRLCTAGHQGWTAGDYSSSGFNVVYILCPHFYINKYAKLGKAFRNRFCLPYTQYLELVEDIRSNKLFDRWCGYKLHNKKCLQWSCSFFVCFVTLVMVGPSMTVKSPLPLIKRSTEDFLCFPCVWQYCSLEKMGVNTRNFAQGAVEHEGVQHGRVPGLHWVMQLYSHCHR